MTQKKSFNSARELVLPEPSADVAPHSPPPLLSTWRLPIGLSSADLSQDQQASLPTDIGTVRVDFQALGDTSSVFNFVGNFFSPVIVSPKSTVKGPFLALRLTSSGHTRLQRSDRSPLQEETPEKYSINFFSESSCRIHYQDGATYNGLACLITTGLLQEMLGGDRIPIPLQRFIDGYDDNFSAMAKTSFAMHRLSAQIRTHPYSGMTAALFVQGAISEMLSLVLTDLAGTDENRGGVIGIDHRRAMAVCDQLIANPASPPSLESLARQVGLPQRRLNKIFQSIFGMTVFEWLVEWRLGHARELLCEGTLSVKEVAFRLGYAHPNNFCTAFARRFGVSPSHFRETIRSVHSMQCVSS